MANHRTLGIHCYVVIFFLLTAVKITLTWNLHVRKEAVHVVPNSYLGYSLAVFEEKGSKGTTRKLLVGAPGDNKFQGKVYQCNFKTTNEESLGFACREAAINAPKSLKGWIGATVFSSQGSATVCAPRGGMKVAGECYSSVNSLSFELLPITNIVAKRQTDWCMTGFSGTYLPINSETDGNTPSSSFLGAVGPYCPTITESRKNANRFQLSTKWMNGQYDGRYGSYAMASGNYGIRKAGGKTFILSSVSFHVKSSFAGKVFFVDNDKTGASLTGYQPGEHFGASLAVSDLNGDGRDDIIIGAPHYTDYEDSALKYEIGSVYIYYQTSKDTFQQGKDHEFIIRGQITGARFGLTVAAIGDTDADGFNDLAIGAPYENEGSGTVYIYHGSSSGLRDRPAQIISGKSFTPPLTTFGFAITAFDFDSNGYNDVFVGAYNSSAVVYLPARPIVTIESDIQFVSDMIQIQKKNCFHTDRESKTDIRVACSNIEFCISYSGQGIPEMKMNVSLTLDINTEKINRRVKFEQNEDDELYQEITFELGKRKCHTLIFYAVPEINETASVVQAKMIIQPLPSKNLTIPPINLEKSSSIVAKNSLSIFYVQEIPWWQYIVGVIGAILILTILTGILYKLGFFKRKLPPTEQAEGEQAEGDQAQN